MSDKEHNRDLTPLEYIVLGLIGTEPQTGYSIVNFFDADAASWSASPGSVYPMLKRLEKREIIAGELEMEHETRPRKVYSLTELGGELLDNWLRELPKLRPYYQERELAMWRFQFMEGRLRTEEVVRWLRNYRDLLDVSTVASQSYGDGILSVMEELGQNSMHRQLVIESTIMELNTMRSWLEMAIMRLASSAYQTGEFKAVLASARGE